MRALLFDVFGTCVDWRTSIMREAERFGLPPQLAQAWRDEYQPQLETVRSGQRPWVNLDVLHEIGLNRVLRAMDLTLTKPDRAELVRGWHRLDPWPDVVAGLTRLKETYIIAPCSNGHIAQSVNLAKFAKLPWDAILGAEIAHAYKPDPRVYLESVYALGLAPDEVCMVAAHRDDLRAAAAVGLQTAFVERFGEDPGPPFDADIVADDFEELLR
ncbi:MAG TPA: haloacid dehalogenase type II [Solirubrobacter sp.]